MRNKANDEAKELRSIRKAGDNSIRFYSVSQYRKTNDKVIRSKWLERFDSHKDAAAARAAEQQKQGLRNLVSRFFNFTGYIARAAAKRKARQAEQASNPPSKGA